MVSFTQSKEVQQWQTLEDGFDKVTRGTAPMPSPGQDEVLVEIKAVSLNYRDTEGMLITPVNITTPSPSHLTLHTTIQPKDHK